MIVFKYTTAKSALRIVEDLRIKLSLPSEFNDPFECTPYSELKLTKSRMRKLAGDTERTKELYQHLVQDGFTRTYSEFLRALRTRVLEERPGIMRRQRQILSAHDMNAIRDASKSLGIFCASRTRTNILMWSHYAENHRGVVLGLDLSKVTGNLPGYFRKVIYSKERVPIDLWMNRNSGRWFDQVTRTIFTKSSAWRYEREYRLVLRLQDLIKTKSGLHLLDIPGTAIREIIFGCWCKPRARNAIEKQLARKPRTFEHVRIFECHRDSSKFGVRLKPKRLKP